MNRDDQIAAMLEAGVTYLEIQQQLHVGYGTVRRVRDDRRIPLLPGRVKRTRAELDALEATVIGMLLSGATAQDVYKTTRFSLNRIADLRRELKIPVPKRAIPCRTVDEAFARYAIPTTTGGHLLWTGTRSGRGLELFASGRIHNARHIAFRKHHGRDPEGYVCRTCAQPGCIHGAHHTDAVMRGTAPGSRS